MCEAQMPSADDNDNSANQPCAFHLNDVDRELYVGYDDGTVHVYAM